uniref:Uncharacterized protein n=1 Tax=Steinernema glaseri TaxID=37863 RepID=A0A1I7Y8E4_9BILA
MLILENCDRGDDEIAAQRRPILRFVFRARLAVNSDKVLACEACHQTTPLERSSSSSSLPCLPLVIPSTGYGSSLLTLQALDVHRSDRLATYSVSWFKLFGQPAKLLAFEYNF